MCIPAFRWRKMKAFSNVCKQYNLKCLRVSSTNGQFHVKAWFSSLTKCKLKISIIHSSLLQYLMLNLQIQNVFQALFLFNLSMRECRLRGVKFPLMEKRIYKYNSRTEWMEGDSKKCRGKEKIDAILYKWSWMEWNGRRRGWWGGLIIIKDMHFDAVRF